MCGLVGHFDLERKGRVREEPIRRMMDRLVHRGPDSSGSFVEPDCGLGFRRLSIIDLAGGDQPMYNEDGSLVLVCNGEIYNHLELRRELAEQGHTFRSRCDVEVILHLYEQHGVECVTRLNGQFAFALYDRRRHSLMLARDPFGICPLHFCEQRGQLLFASEAKALLAHPEAPRAVDLLGLDQVLCFPGLVSPRTMFAGVSSLPAGHSALVEDGRLAVRKYWDLDYPRLGEEPPEQPESFYVEGLRERLAQSVRYRLQSDVPVGFYLSGGLDSSLIGGLIRHVAPAVSFQSFSISFEEQRISEEAHQKSAASWLGSLHTETRFDARAILDRLRTAVGHAECPLRESYNTASLALSKAAKEHGITVILTGEGSDELFAGYIGYRFDRHRGGRDRGSTLDQALEQELRARLWGDPDLLYEREYAAFRETKTALYSEAVNELLRDGDCLDGPLVDATQIAGRDPIHQRSYLDFKLRLVDHLVSDHGDRMAMANSVEARYPFLDVGVVEFARQIPPRLKLNGFTEKYVVKRAAEGFVKQEIIDREKWPFFAPGSPALLRSGEPWVADLLSHERVKRQGYFNADVVERLKVRYSQEGFKLNLPYEDDFLMIVLSFNLFLDIFEMPSL
jgi:asparagine synthase (glutamine-hydrolysing)